ncbi:MAG: MotA/TolQ/ExbB proton channel family protein [Candidatus Margulisiibacteriota bacterium]
MDLTTVLGISLALTIASLVVSFHGSISVYWDLEAFLIAFGGTFAATLINTPFPNLLNAIKSSFFLLFSTRYKSAEVIPLMKKLSEKAKKEGVFALKNEGKNWPDAFLEKAVSLLMLNFGAHAIRTILENEIIETRARHRSTINVLRTAALYAPVFGLFGTLLGVIQVLTKIGNPAEVGPAMATAVMASVYGILLAYMVLHPIAGKLRLRDDEEILAKAMILEGILLIRAHEMPSAVEKHLYSYVSSKPKLKK